MSATNRGSIRKKSDFYPTPEYTTKSLLDNHELKGNILEPSAGYGNISSVIKKYYPDNYLKQIEIFPYFIPFLKQYGDYEIVDYLKWKPKIKYNTIITNPPYSIAEKLLRHTFNIIDKNTEVIMLLRVGFLESKTRKPFWNKYPMINKLYVLQNRPKFINGSSDATTYAWFIWDWSNKQEIKIV